jgi:hypothetical protein
MKIEAEDTVAVAQQTLRVCATEQLLAVTEQTNPEIG